ncbi:MAG: class I SAM-dependent methyltransferase [Bryobacteraceae bacterium]|nr:class I SAM-dependent methyltransferase [Bryobacteraceae bacterium]
MLEVGCGNGNVTRALQLACPGAFVVGVDLFAEGLQAARRRGVTHLVRADMASFPFRTGFDLVGLFDTLEHIPDDMAALRMIRGATLPGGSLLLTVPAHQHLWSYFDEASHHCRRYEVDDLVRKCTEAAFRVEYATEFMCAAYPLVRLRRSWIDRRRLSEEQKSELVTNELKLNPAVNAILDLAVRAEELAIRRRRRLRPGTSILVVGRT